MEEAAMDFFEVAHTQKAMRRLKADDVSDEHLWRILHTATMAPNGGNRQPWNFVVVRDAEKKRKIGEWYLDAWQRSYGPAREAMLRDPQMAKTYNSADYLARHIADAPVLVFATIRKDMMAVGPTLGASIYPAVQNLMLAARALGLGTTLTTLHKMHEQDVKALLGVPDDVETMAMIPVGWPRGNFGEPARLPVDKVVYWESWGERRANA
jgi:nitroreductase